MLYQFLLYGKVTQSFIHIYILFLILFSIMVYLRRVDIASCAAQQDLLFIHSKCNSLHLLAPNSQSIPLSVFSLLATTSLFSMPVSLLLF